MRATGGSASESSRRSLRLDLGYNPSAAPEARKAALDRWKSWWRKNSSNRVYYSQTSMANPVRQAFVAQTAEIARQAGPYALSVVDRDGKAIGGAVVAYSYYFTTFDGTGEKRGDRVTTDADGRLLMGHETVAAGMRFVGADVIVARAGYDQEAIHLLPHLLTPNSFSIVVTLEPKTE